MKANLGKYETAVSDFKRALEMDPEYVLAYNGRGMAILQSGQNPGKIRVKALADGLKQGAIEIRAVQGL